MSTQFSPSSQRKSYIVPGTNKQGAPLAQNNLSRSLPRQMSTGTLRGTQKVGYGNVEIDSSNNRITIGVAGESYIGMGTIPGFPDEIGFFTVDNTGQLSMKIVGGTNFVS